MIPNHLLVQSVEGCTIDDLGVTMACVQFRINRIGLSLSAVTTQETWKSCCSFNNIIDVYLNIDGFDEWFTAGSRRNDI